MRSLPVVATIVLLLAGCAEKGDTTQGPGAAGDPSDSALPPGVTSVLEGTILGADVGPLEGVLLKLDKSNETRTTDAGGYYRFENLPGGDYIVIATLDAYRAKTQRAVVEEDRVFQLDFVLEAIPIAIPYHETAIRKGLIECQVHYQTSEDNPNRPNCGAGVDPNASPNIIFTVGPSASQILIEMVWTPRTSLSNHLTLGAAETEGGTELAYTHSAPTLRVAVSESVVKKFYNQGGELRTTVQAGPSVTGDEAAADAGVAFQQDYEIHLTVFYHAIGPPTFTAIPE